VVIGLIAAMSFLLIGGLAGGGKSAALQAGQSTVANLLAAARTRAMASGNQTRVLVQQDVQSSVATERYGRFLALEELRDGNWETIQTMFLPAGIYVVPHQNRTPPNLFGTAAPWTKLDGSRLHSSCLNRSLLTRPVDGTISEGWIDLPFTAQGTPSASGLLAVATGQPLAPGSFAAGESPFMLENQESVRGLQLTSYGLAILINDRSGF